MSSESVWWMTAREDRRQFRRGTRCGHMSTWVCSSGQYGAPVESRRGSGVRAVGSGGGGVGCPGVRGEHDDIARTVYTYTASNRTGAMLADRVPSRGGLRFRRRPNGVLWRSWPPPGINMDRRDETVGSVCDDLGCRWSVAPARDDPQISADRLGLVRTSGDTLIV
jgi:hypothetical protein